MRPWNPRRLALAALLAAGLLAAPSAASASSPEVTSVIQGRDGASDRPVLVLLGKSLTKFKGWTLSGPGGSPAMDPPDVLLQSKGTVVLGLPEGTPAGSYELAGSQAKGDPVIIPFGLGAGPVAWEDIEGLPAAFADGTDADTHTWEVKGADAHRESGRVGVGTSEPAATLDVAGSDGVLFQGTFGKGAVPATGPGTRALWYPGKAAFRAGEVSGSEWDEDSIGEHSFAAGDSTAASGNSSVAFGAGTAVSGDWSAAFGKGCTVKGYCSLAAGIGTEAPAAASMALGEGTVAAAYGSLVIGRWNVVEGDPKSWSEKDPLLVAGNGTSDDEKGRSNALTLYQDGNLVIAGKVTESSDARLKEEVAPLTGVLPRLAGIGAVTYRFRKGVGGPTGTQIGLLAQEVRAAFPELVEEDAAGRLSVAYGKFSAVLLEAVKEQQATLEARGREVEALRAEVAELRRMLATGRGAEGR